MPDYMWPGRGAGSGSFDVDGPGPAPAAQVTSAGYDDSDVVDGHPRTVSNLVVDQTDSNPAAVAAAGAVPGSSVDEATGEIFIPNESPDEGLSAPFNSWMTLFGQFFDHGLDLVNKGGNGTVYIPLNDDDPLVVGDPADPADDLPAGLRFMPLTRATVVGSAPNGARLHNNQTTPFVDQNQTYTSHPAHQVFLREYETSSGSPRSTGRLLDGAQGGLVSWAELKTVTAATLGIELDDMDVLNVPQVQTDLYGQFDPGQNGYPQLVFTAGEEPAGATCVQGDDANTYVLCEGDPAAPVDATGARRTNHAFLDDIAHAAVPRPGGGHNAALLGQHFITGDGRGNENIGLTAVHHVFHAEHNRLAGVIADMLAANPSLDAAYRSTEPTSWGYGARLFQAARYVTEMQYQHLVFEEFARTLSPTIDPAPFNESTYHPTINAAIPAEFAHTVYRFGHSMLTDTIARRGFGATDIGLIEGFLNPAAFTMNGALTPDQGAGAIINGMVAQTGNGIDEFVVEALRNNLLGLPLDLASINMARAREAGVPPLQEVRALLFEESGDPALAPYADWNDFGAALKHPASLRNFIAAYAVDDPAGGPPLSLAERRAQADVLMADPAFMSSAQGLDGIDMWMGGLAEAGMPFGGMLGTTFNHVFERTLENLQNGDRFYYLNRNIGLNLFHQLEANSFSALVQRTTAASEVPTNIFASQDGVVYDLEVIAPAVEAAATPRGADPDERRHLPLPR